MVGRKGNTLKTRVQEPSDLRAFRLKFCILIPKYIRTYSACQRKIGSYIKKNTPDLMFKFWILIVKIFVAYCFLVLPIKYYSFHKPLL